MGFSGHCLGKQRLTGSRRAYQQGTFGQLGTNGRIFPRIVKEINHLLERFLGLILACHIPEGDSGLFLHIGFGLALADAAHHTAAFVHPAEHKAEQGNHQNNRYQNTQQAVYQLSCYVGLLLVKTFNTCFFKTFGKFTQILHQCNRLGLRCHASTMLQGNCQSIGFQNYTLYFPFVQHCDKFTVINFAGIFFAYICHHIHTEQHDYDTNKEHQKGLLILRTFFIWVLVSILVLIHLFPPIIISSIIRIGA